MNELLCQLEWQLPHPPWMDTQRLPVRRLWGLAKQFLRRNQLQRQVSDFELFAVLGDTLLYCLRKFDPRRGPKQGKPGRQPIEDRFVWYCNKRLAGRIARWAVFLRGDDRRASFLRYAQRRAEDFAAPKGDLLGLVPWAVERLDVRSRLLIELRFWRDASLDTLASSLGFANRFRAKRELDGILKRLRRIILDAA